MTTTSQDEATVLQNANKEIYANYSCQETHPWLDVQGRKEHDIIGLRLFLRTIAIMCMEGIL